MSHSDQEEPNKLEKYGLEIRHPELGVGMQKSTLEPDASFITDAMQKTSNLGYVERFKTHLSVQKASGEMLRQAQETAIHYQGKTLDLAERLGHDLRSQQYLNEAQRIGGKLSTELLQAANIIAEENVAITTDAIAQTSVLEQQRQAQISDMLEKQDIRECDAAEVSQVSQMLTKITKQDALDRHMKVTEQQRNQFTHAIEIDPTQRRKK